MKYQIEDCGIDHTQYFPGRGVAFTEWDHCFIGAGSSPYEAAEDAIEQLAYSDLGIGLDKIKNTLRKRVDSRLLHYEDCPRSRRWNAECDCGDSELYYYAALYIKE